MQRIHMRGVAIAMISFAGLASAQPALIGLTGSPIDMTPDGQSVLTSTGVWRRAGGFTDVTGGVGISADAAFVAGNIVNTAGVGGLPTDAQISGRFTVATGVWQNLGIFNNGSVSGGVINSAYGTSSTGRFVVGGGYFLGPNFRAYLWDANTSTMVSLGSLAGDVTRANSVSQDGSLVVGFEGGSRRPTYWFNRSQRYLTGSTQGEIYTCNDAGTIMLGVSNQFQGQIVRWTGSGTTWTAASLGAMDALPSWLSPGSNIVGTTPIAMSQDGTVIVGFVTYFDPIPAPGHLVRGAFLRTPELGIVDVRDYLNSVGAIGREAFPGGYETATCISADGTKFAGWTLAPQPSWYVDLLGGGCTAPSIGSTSGAQQLNGCSQTFLNISASGTAPLTYQWRKDGTDIFDGPTPWGSEIHIVGNTQLRIVNGKPEDVGTYDCVVTNACGTATTPGISVTYLAAATNDSCANAADVGEGTFAFNMCAARDQEAVASCAAGASGYDAFYRYTPTRSGTAAFSTCASDFNSVLSLGNGCFGETHCNDDACGIKSRIEGVAVTAGVPIYVRVALRDVNVTGTATGSLQIANTVTCVADMDDGSGTGTPDGGVTIDDLLYYLGIYGDGVIRADVDDGSGTGTPDGGVTIDDLLYFLVRYAAGC